MNNIMAYSAKHKRGVPRMLRYWQNLYIVVVTLSSVNNLLLTHYQTLAAITMVTGFLPSLLRLMEGLGVH